MEGAVDRVKGELNGSGDFGWFGGCAGECGD